MNKRQPGSCIPDETLSSAVASLVEAQGVNSTAKTLGIGREATVRIAGRMHVRAGTIALAAMRLAAQPSSEPTAAAPPVPGRNAA